MQKIVLLRHLTQRYQHVSRLGLTQEIGSAHEEGTVILPGPAIVPILWNDFTKSKIQTSWKHLNVSIGISTYISYIIIDILNQSL